MQETATATTDTTSALPFAPLTRRHLYAVRDFVALQVARNLTCAGRPNDSEWAEAKRIAFYNLDRALAIRSGFSPDAPKAGA